MLLAVHDVGNSTIEVGIGDFSYSKKFLFQIDEGLQKQIRWYFEEYTKFPYGANVILAGEVEREIITVGTTLFNEIIPPEYQEIFFSKTDGTLNTVKIEIESPDLSIIALPWEFMFHSKIGYLLLKTLGVYRNMTGSKPSTNVLRQKDIPFRILMVISRPFDYDKIPIKTVSFSLIEALAKYGGNHLIHFEVLRPATFANFKQKVLEEANFDLIHFDGHGFLGHLQFENDSFGPDNISGKDIALCFPSYAPIFVVNACYSATETDNNEITSVASELLKTSTKAVIAMPFAVHATTVETFAYNFYNSLFSGRTFMEAVSKGQRELSKLKDNGKNITCDWMIPRVFLSDDDFDINITNDGQEKVVNIKELEKIFFRDKELLRLDRLLSNYHNGCVFISGIIGEGKTYFVKNFANWYLATQGTYRTIFFNYIDDKLSFAFFEELNIEKKSLLIFDQMDEFVDNLSSEPIRNRFISWLLEMKKINSKVIIVSRCPPAFIESQLFHFMPLEDLPNDTIASQLVDTLTNLDISKSISGDEIEELISIIGWHAATLVDVMKLLSNYSVEYLSDLLTEHIEDYNPGLGVSEISSAFESLTERDQQLFSVLGLFGRRIFSSTLSIFSDGGLKEDVFKMVYGRSVTSDEWNEVLLKAKNKGLGRWSDNGVLEMSCEISFFLKINLAKNFTSSEAIKSLQSGIVHLYSGVGHIWREQLASGRSELYTIFIIEEHNFELALFYSIKLELWDEAISIFETFVFYINFVAYDRHILSRFIKIIFRKLEKHKWKKYSLQFELTVQLQWVHLFNIGNLEIGKYLLEMKDIIHTNFSPDLQDKLIEVVSLIVEHFRSNKQFGRARETLDELKNVQPLSVDSNYTMEITRMDAELAVDLDEYESAFLLYKQLKDSEIEKNDLYSACIYAHQLGVVCYEMGKYTDAQNNFLFALRTRQLLGIKKYQNTDKYQMGMVAEKLLQLKQAVSWFEDSVKDSLAVNDESTAAGAGYSLGRVYEQLDLYELAISWINFAKPIYENKSIELQVAHCIYELGIIYLKMKEFKLAEENIFQALRLYEKIDAKEEEADSYMLLGTVSIEDGDYLKALSYMESALSKLRLSKKPSMLMLPILNVIQACYSAKNYSRLAHLLEEAAEVSIRTQFYMIKEIYDWVLRVKDVIAEDIFFENWNQEVKEAALKFSDFSSLVRYLEDFQH